MSNLSGAAKLVLSKDAQQRAIIEQLEALWDAAEEDQRLLSEERMNDIAAWLALLDDRRLADVPKRTKTIPPYVRAMASAAIMARHVASQPRYEIDSVKKRGHGTGTLYRVWDNREDDYATDVMSLVELRRWWAKFTLNDAFKTSDRRSKTVMGWRPSRRDGTEGATS